MKESKGVLLCVDDNVEFCRLMIKFFIKRGYDVIPALSAEEAYEVLKKQKVDMLLLDLRMKGMGGRGLLEKLRDEKINIPTLILTAFITDIPALEQEKFKLCGYFEKPVSLANVHRAIKKYLKKH